MTAQRHCAWPTCSRPVTKRMLICASHYVQLRGRGIKRSLCKAARGEGDAAAAMEQLKAYVESHGQAAA